MRWTTKAKVKEKIDLDLKSKVFVGCENLKQERAYYGSGDLNEGRSIN